MGEAELTGGADVRDVVVVGSGPNGLAAAVTLARAGLDVLVLEAEGTVGGGARTAPLGCDVVLRPGADAAAVAGLPHDLCSAVHPLAVASPFFQAFDLAAHGVRLVAPEASYAHPLGAGQRSRAAVAYRDLDRTLASLHELGGSRAARAWERTFRPLVDRHDAVARLLLDDRRRALRAVPGAPAARGAAAASAVARGILAPPRSGVAGALFAGVAVHAMAPLASAAAAGTGALLGTLAHARGWPVPVGGSQAITDALVADLQVHGGKVVTGVRVRSRRDLPPARDYVLDTNVPTALAVLGDDLPVHVRAALRRFRGGPAAATVALVLDGPVPWADDAVGQAGTVHLGGSVAEIRAAQAAVRAGRHAERPVVLLGDPTVADPARERGGLRVVWAYAHVPAGSDRDVTEDVLSQLERYAPGVRDRVVATRCTPAVRLSEHDENLRDGDIASGAITTWQMVARPRLAWEPHLLGDVGRGSRAYLASAATPPGPGVHGMGGFLAAQSLLRRRGLDPGAAVAGLVAG
ncbi:phytoene dehydrogenase-like protein [Flavimobilis soli]|uniref:Phytoene dehydrogenase-like protein n=1 Tax=Flavimobilis soli TaxID=442709 RepID=A0A2A9EE99_9MICO|nr:NAD(P)/FAD-dependent oxidoreductase [Flavimobilis soli]PFG37367.1 phytoene dehydrogenase-like protein [Flavimobilis soli]